MFLRFITFFVNCHSLVKVFNNKFSKPNYILISFINLNSPDNCLIEFKNVRTNLIARKQLKYILDDDSFIDNFNQHDALAIGYKYGKHLRQNKI